jgi:hypothetical protein
MNLAQRCTGKRPGRLSGHLPDCHRLFGKWHVSSQFPAFTGNWQLGTDNFLGLKPGILHPICTNIKIGWDQGYCLTVALLLMTLRPIYKLYNTLRRL